MILSDEERDKRLAVCANCPHMTGTLIPFCTQCGCLLKIKSRFAVFHCPLGKWENDPVQEEYIKYEHKCNSCGNN